MEDQYPKASRAWAGVAILFLLYSFSYIDRAVLQVVVDPVGQALQIGDIQMSILLGGAFAIFYGVVGLPLARVADTSNRRRLILFGSLLWAACTMLCGFATSFWMLVVFRVGLAIGEAALSPAAYSLIADWFPPHKRSFPSTMYTFGVGFGSKAGLIALGVVVALVVEQRRLSDLPILSRFEPWQLMFFVVAVPTFVLIAMFALYVPEPKRVFTAGESDKSPTLSEIWRYLLRNRALYGGLLIGCGLNNLCSAAFAVWGPQLMKRNYGWEISHAAIALGALTAATSFIGFIVIPRLSDMLRDRLRRPDIPILVAIGLSIVGCATMACAALSHNPYVFLALDTIGAPLLTGSAILCVTALPIIAPSRMRGVLSSIYVLVSGSLTVMIAPTAAALMSTYLFPSQGARALTTGVATMSVIAPLFTVTLLWLARRPYADAIQKHLFSTTDLHAAAVAPIAPRGDAVPTDGNGKSPRSDVFAGA